MLRPCGGNCGVRAVEQHDHVAFGAKRGFQDARSVIENAEDAYHWSRVDGFAERFVVEANVSTGDGRAKLIASDGEAVDGFAELPHNIRFFRAAEIEAIRCGDGACAGR